MHVPLKKQNRQQSLLVKDKLCLLLLKVTDMEELMKINSLLIASV